MGRLPSCILGALLGLSLPGTGRADDQPPGPITAALAAPRAGAPPAPPASGAEATPAEPADEEEAGALSKKAQWLKEKAGRRAVHARRAAPTAEPVVSLHNLWTGEVLPLREGAVPPERWSAFLRCHHTNQRIEMDGRLLGLVRAAARRFRATVVEIISGFRAPKYNLLLRKKGRQVARDSQHTHGNAVDFRLPGVPIRELRRFVLAQRLGGVGFYPRSLFVHADTGPVRTWVAE